MNVLALFFLPLAGAVLMNATAFGNLLQLALDFRYVSEYVTTQEQYLAYRHNGLHEIPACPSASPLFECEGVDGDIVSLRLDLGHLRLPNNVPTLYNNWNFKGGPRFRRLEVTHFTGVFGFEPIFSYVYAAAARSGRSVVLSDSTFGSVRTGDLTDLIALLDVNELILSNVSFPDIKLSNSSSPLPKACSFVNVRFVCPVPSWIWRCFNGTTVEPPCWNGAQPVPEPTGSLLAVSVFKIFNPDWAARPPFELMLQGVILSCDPPPLADSACQVMRDPVYFPAFGPTGTVVMRFPVLGRGVSVSVQDLYASNLTTLLEVFDWETGQYVVAVNRTAPRDSLSARTVDVIAIPRVLTNTVRLTFEHILPTDSIYTIILKIAFTTVSLAPFVPYREPCPDALTLGARRSLDETIADSYCVNRLCQLACPDADAARVGNFSFGAPVDAMFVAIEGGSGWPNGSLVMQTSDETRVYMLNGTNVTQVTLPGVVDAQRVRLIGTTPAASVDTTIVRLPGQFVKKLRQQLLSSDLKPSDWRPVGALAAPFATTEASLAVVNGTTFVYSVANNTVFRAGADNDWIDLRPALSDLFVNLSDVPRGVVRRMVSVSERFLIVIGANVNERYDGSRMRDWLARRVAATPLDVYDTVSDRWNYGLLQHGIESASIDVVTLDAARFVVVDRQRTRAVEIAWRPFPYELVECSANGNCNACLTNVGNIAECRWCEAGRCVDRLAVCSNSTIDIAMCPAPTTSSVVGVFTSSGESETTTSLAAGSSGGVSQQQPQMTAPGMMSDSADPLVGLYIAIAVVLFLIAVGAPAIGIWQWKKRRGASAAAAEGGAPMQEAKDAQFDPNARYGNFEESGEGAYDVGNFPEQE